MLAVCDRDHPRSRGVYSKSFLGAASWAGSSPLARGLPRNNIWNNPLAGIIPARAGFTGDDGEVRDVADHPRSRGVYLVPGLFMCACQGSSPLARGLRPTGIGKPRGVRIIPARAGFTVNSWLGQGRNSDHPRSRGVYRGISRPGYRRRGSSPLARGLPEAAINENGDIRIIPARAGFTFHDRRHGTRRADHPRSRGVYGLSV